MTVVSRPARMAFEALCGAAAIAIEGVKDSFLLCYKSRELDRVDVSRNVVGVLGNV